MATLARPAASGRNAPGGLVPQPKRRVTRTANAKMLRGKFMEIQESPDGADMDPLTLPKCVECAHCGWPVYPRDSKVATKKTFARAGIERSSKKEEEAKRKAAIEAALDAGEEIPPELLAAEGEAGSDADSRDTVERMADDLQDLQDKNEELEKRVDQLETQNKELEEKVATLEKELEEALDRVSFLEEAEERWRDKLSKARIEIERLLQVLERASFVSSDREGGLVAALMTIRGLREEIAIMKRRRALMLLQLQIEWKKKQEEEDKTTLLKLWKNQAAKDVFERKMDALEARRRQEVGELQEQLTAERARVRSLEAHVGRMEGKLKQAAHRLLERSLGTKTWPHSQAHALRTWCGIHPSLVNENELERTRQTLQETNNELRQTQARNQDLSDELDETKKQKMALMEQVVHLEKEIVWIKEEAGLDEASMARKRAAEAAKEAAWLARVKAVQDKLDELQERYDTETEDLMKQLKATQSRLQITEDALAAASGGAGSGQEPDAMRVVPNGQGILCTGCLKQVLLRDITPLPPKAAMTASVPELETARRAFFKKGLGGRLQTDDAFQNKMWNDAKDPYRLSRLNQTPWDAITSPSGGAKTPQTGLPALKKDKSGGSLRTTMKDFRPRAFR